MSNNLIFAIQKAVQVITDPLFESYQMYRFYPDEYSLELKVQIADNPNERTRVLRVIVDPVHKQIGIPNIFVPMELKHQGYGKKIIAAILAVANQDGYALFVIDLVPSFHRRLIARGALPVDHETVQITDTTRLDGRSEA